MASYLFKEWTGQLHPIKKSKLTNPLKPVQFEGLAKKIAMDD